MPIFAWTATLLAAANFAAACREYTARRPSSIVMGGSNTLQIKAANTDSAPHPLTRCSSAMPARRLAQDEITSFGHCNAAQKGCGSARPSAGARSTSEATPARCRRGWRSSSDGEPTFTSLRITRRQTWSSGQLVSSALAHPSTEPAFVLSHHLNFGRCEPGSGKTAPRR